MHQPTFRVLQVLQAVCEGEDPRLAELSRQTGIPKSTLVPILQTLCDMQYLYISDAGRYSPGAALFRLGTEFKAHMPLLELVREQLESLVEALGETCFFGILDMGDVLYLQKVDSTQPLRMLTNVGKRLPAYATGIGKALLSGLDGAALRSLYPKGLAPLTERTITDPGVLLQQLEQVRRNGYAWESEESTPHVRCFAVPVYKNGQLVAAVSVSIPLFRYADEQKPAIIHHLQQAAATIGLLLEQTDAHFGEYF